MVSDEELPGARPKDPPIIYCVYRPTTVMAEGKADATSDGTKLPLILALHGGTGTARQFTSFLMAAAEANGAILVGAQGFREVVGAQGYWWKGDTEEEGMLDRLLDHVQKTLPVDPARLYVIGVADGAELGIKWATEKDRGVKGVIAVNFLWKPPSTAKAPKEMKFCLIASRDAKEKMTSLAEQAEKSAKLLSSAKYPVVLRIVPGASRTFFHGWEKEVGNALRWFDDKLDWPKELEGKEEK